jgi:hypothetical protein
MKYKIEKGIYSTFKAKKYGILAGRGWGGAQLMFLGGHVPLHPLETPLVSN